MTTRFRTGRRLTAAVLLAATITVTACGHARSKTASVPSRSGVSVVPAPATPTVPATDVRAQAARTRAIAATSALRSYTFRTVATIGNDLTSVSGAATMPSDVTYTLSTKATTQQVVRVAGRTYVRSVPGTWNLVRKPATPVSPLRSLIAGLNAVEGLSLDASGQRLTGTLTAAGAASSGLISRGTLAGPVTVTFVVDSAGRVRTFSLASSLVVARRIVPLTENTTYAAFNRAPLVRAP